MPILGPTNPPGPTIADYAAIVCDKLEGRSSMLNPAIEWVANVLVELTGDTDLRDDFDELEAWGDQFSLVPGQQEYPFSNFLNPNLIYNQATLSVMLWIDPPSNYTRVKLHPGHYQDADRMTTSTQSKGSWSQPSDWYRFADMIGFNPIPNLNYTVQARCLQLFPINEGSPETVGTTPVLLTRQWKDFIIQSAVMRGFMDLQQFDKAAAIKALLYGDPKHPTDKGMLGALHTRRKKELYRESIGLRPVVRTYGFGGGRG
jgi:hypothetical protein